MKAGKPHHRAKDITGLKVGYLTATEYAGSDGKKSLWLVTCTCGSTKTLAATELTKMQKRGILASCGCKKSESIARSRTTHGMSKHPAFAVWRSMIDRCTLPTHQAWNNYGGRGIRVCRRWKESFEAFWADMGATYEPGLTLDRKDNSLHYTPENCRWATYSTQANNRRNNVRINGKTIKQLSMESGIGQSTLWYRLSRGWPLDKLLLPPKQPSPSTTSSTADPATDSSSVTATVTP